MFNFKLPKIESLSTTVSQNLIQPPMFHYFQETPKYMYWYSNNSIPIYNSKSNKIEGDLSYLKYAKIDKHYVWTKDFGNLIRKISGKKFQVCNPILFYPSKDIGILIFDVIPFKRYNDVSYYSERNCMKFIDDIVKVHKAIGSNYDIGPLILKPKREFIRAHSKTYAKQIKALNKLGVIKLENCNVNLLDLISRTKIVICMPLSSPALIAHRLGVPTCYYNPNSDFFFSRFNYGIKVIDSAEGLEFFCKTVLG
jgi:polysaccharide biosynthesis PFTS motif protein